MGVTTPLSGREGRGHERFPTSKPVQSGLHNPLQMRSYRSHSGGTGATPDQLRYAMSWILRVATFGAITASMIANAAAAEPFTLTSSAFKDGDIWPSKFAGKDPARTNPPCPGENISPPL